MSRSLKKTPIFGIATSEDMKRWKRQYNRSFRHAMKSRIGILANNEEFLDGEDGIMLPTLIDHGDPVMCIGLKYYWIPSVFWQKRGLQMSDYAEIEGWRRMMRK